MNNPHINVVLVHPEIPQNTGSIGRLCVGLGARLHIIRPMGFVITDKNVQRAGLDYWVHLDLSIHDDWESFLKSEMPEKLCFCSTKGVKSHFDYEYVENCYLVFGCETAGLPAEFYTRYADSLYRIPMPGEHARSINLANAVGIVMYETYRQLAS